MGSTLNVALVMAEDCEVLEDPPIGLTLGSCGGPCCCFETRVYDILQSVLCSISVGCLCLRRLKSYHVIMSCSSEWLSCEELHLHRGH